MRARSVSRCFGGEVVWAQVGHPRSLSGVDVLRLAVTPVKAEPDGFQVQIWVNDVEMTAAGAGMGMDPYDVLVPSNRFAADDAPQTIPVARCTCGVYGCGSTDVQISKVPSGIQWEWRIEVPMDRSPIFEPAAYEREIERVAQDHSWETPVRTAGRLVLTSIDNEELPAGLRFDWVANNWRRPESFQVCLRNGSSHQIFIDVDWVNRSPEELSKEVRRLLVDTDPKEWTATWSSIQRSDSPPTMAGERWTQVRF